MARNKIIFFLFFSPYISGCGDKGSLSLSEYFDYVHKNEGRLTTRDSARGIIVSVEYLLPAILALREAGSLQNLSSQYQTLINNYKDADYFELTLSKSDQSTRKYLKTLYSDQDTSQSAFEEYIDFGIQNEIQLLRGNDTIPCAYLHREISESISNKFKYTVSFVTDSTQWNSKTQADRAIIFNSQKLGIRNIKLSISSKQIQSFPTINI
ncbi:MAG TPA: hypothetical protein VE978_26175 [Chitinophagales bacterium]|nr:hypothetical protein [Chitinophagales bacterium]